MLENLKDVLDIVKSKFSADPQLLYAKLAISNYLQRNELDLVVNQLTTDMKTAILFLILRDTSETILLELQQIFFNYGWDELLELLQEKLHDCKREDLLWTAPETTSGNSHQEDVKRSKIVRQNLQARYKEDCQFIQQFWTGYLESVSMQKSYVDLEIEQLTVSAKSTGERINSYQDLFTNKREGGYYKRILVEGDPGSGKSTYVNKIAFDWANGNPELLAMFDYVFIFPLQSLVVGIEESINSFVPNYLRAFIRGQLESPSSKVLFIFDGFDEMDPTKDNYKSVVSILNKEKFCYCSCIVTSRRSHVDQLPPVCREQWLLLNGFDDESVITYMKNQGCQDVQYFLAGSDSENFRQLLRIPMFCAIYCSLWLGGALKDMALDIYSLIDIMIDNYLLVAKESKKFTKEDLHNQVQIISEFAITKLDSLTKQVLTKPVLVGHDKSVYVVDDILLVSRISSITLGLISRRFITTGKYKDFSLTFTFPHQLIAECLAARLIFKQFDFKFFRLFTCRSELYDVYEVNTFDLPFVQFLMTCILKEIKSRRPNLNVLEPFIADRHLCLYLIAKSGKNFLDFEKRKNVFLTTEYINEFAFSNVIGRTKEFFTTLNSCANMIDLNLKFCNLTVDSIGCLTEGLYGNCFQKLQRLHLGGNENVGNSPKLIESLKNCHRLHRLDLSCCNLSRQSVVAMSGTINESLFRELEELRLYGNREIGKYLPICDSLLKCLKLTVLDVGYCYLEMETFDHFASLFGEKISPFARFFQVSFDIHRLDSIFTEFHKFPTYPDFNNCK